MEKEFESRTCVTTNGFLRIFQNANTSSSGAAMGNEMNLQVGSTNRLSAISPARSNTSIANSAAGVTT